MSNELQVHSWRNVVIVVFLLALTGGCGGGENSAGEAKQSGAGSDLIAESQRMMSDAKAQLTFEAPGSPIDASKAEGDEVAIVSVDQRVPALAQAAEAAQEAAQAAGVQVSLFDSRSDVTRMQQGIEQGIRQAQAIVLLGVPTDAVQGALEQAREADIPVVSVLNNEPIPDAPGQGAGPLVYATSAPSYEKAGALIAAKAIVDTDAGANVVIFNCREIKPSSSVVKGMKSMLDRCAECEVSENSTPLADWSTALTGKAQSEITRNPNADYFLPIFDDMAIFVTAGVRQAGATGRVKVASFNGTPAALKMVQEGDVVMADPGQSNAWIGWHSIDQAMRGMLGEKPSNPEIPIRFFDEASLRDVNVDDVDALYGSPKFRDGFTQLWGVG